MSSIDRADIWFAVVNSFAASKKAAALWKSAEKLLKEREVKFHGVRTGNAGNAAELFAMPDIDGGLVGGASLKADFGVIANA